MKKEAIICIVIILLIILGNYFTGDYTKSSIRETNQKLEELKHIISQNEQDQDLAKRKMDEIDEKWHEKYNILTYYIAHNELEKIETELVGLKSSIDTEEYTDAINELDRATYLLGHIEEINKLDLKNIF